ncbi:hypothetical protein B6U66_04905 [Candidatus Bathyarchaeota archaeon ex4484_135]|nr:MAG: hypothetical protein B6U66_04905 [Candidatus Bathyarchaeota archaeon ex4484_135]
MEFNQLTITVLLDNEPFLPGLKPDWGLSIHLGADDGRKILMDTGGTPGKLFYNARALGIDLADLDAIFISHWHGDHCGSLPELLEHVGREIEVFVPRRPGPLMSRTLRKLGAKLVEVPSPREVLPGFYSTGDMGGEHALVADISGLGLMLLTGCSHPGPANMVRRTLEALGKSIYGLMGGFHISSYAEGRELGFFLADIDVKVVCPCHCTGALAKRGLIEALPGRVLQCGTGRTLRLTREGLSEAFGKARGL